MTFSNPAGTAAAAASNYIRALLDLLGSRDPLQVLDELHRWLVRRVHGLPDSVLRRPEKPGKWSVIEVIQHLADSELDYRHVGLGQASEQLHALRTANLHLWKSLTPAQLERMGLHSERGPESAGHILRLMAGHDLVHRRQIDRILAATGAPAL
jgi:uncharacterized damage-inducible protein DinB